MLLHGKNANLSNILMVCWLIENRWYRIFLNRDFFILSSDTNYILFPEMKLAYVIGQKVFFVSNIILNWIAPLLCYLVRASFQSNKIVRQIVKSTLEFYLCHFNSVEKSLQEKTVFWWAKLVAAIFYYTKKIHSSRHCCDIFARFTLNAGK